MNRKIVNIMGLVGSLLVFLILASSLVKSIRRIKEGNAVIEKTKVRLEKINEENNKLSNQLQITQSDEFVEKQLRDKLGLAKEGEIILILPEPDIVRKLAPVVPEEETIKPKTNLGKWIELFN